jgi:hypothetical protein
MNYLQDLMAPLKNGPKVAKFQRHQIGADIWLLHIQLNFGKDADQGCMIECDMSEASQLNQASGRLTATTRRP